MREKYSAPAFMSVILSGVHDIRHLRLRIRPDEAHKRNSPWNIAASFDGELSFSVADIEKMLEEYRSEHGVCMESSQIAESIFDYTAGHPFLVSKICKMLDEDGYGWSREGISEAVKKLLSEEISLFESLKNRLVDYPDMSFRIQRLLFDGSGIPDNPDDEELSLAKMYGFINVRNNVIAIANRIFEMRLYNYFMTTAQAINSEMYRAATDERNIFIKQGALDMDLIIERFAFSFNDIYGSEEAPFIEEVGRRYFLLYLKPIINGRGNYYIEARTRNRLRMDVVVDYLGKQYVVELKIWRGSSYNERGEEQLFDYLEHYHTDRGWLVSFCFNKNKRVGIHEVKLGDKTIVEAIV